MEGASCQDSEPHRVLPNGWSISHPCRSEVLSGNAHGKNVFLPVYEAPLERPHPSPFLRSMSLELGNSLECWAPAGEQSCRVSQSRDPGMWKETFEGRGRMS